MIAGSLFLAATLTVIALAPAAHLGKSPDATPAKGKADAQGAAAEVAKEGKDSQPAKGRLVEHVPFLVVSPFSGFPATAIWAALLRRGVDKAAGTKGDGDKAAKPEKEASPVEALIKVLKDDNRVVRKRAILLLGKMGSECKAAIPALMEVAGNDAEAKEIVDLANDVLYSPKRFTIADFTEVLVKTLQDTEQDQARRLFACRMLPGIHEAATATKKTKEAAAIYKALEDTVTDDDAELRRAAAMALEIIDTEVARAAGKTTKALTQTVHALMDPAFLKRLQVTPEQVQKAVQAKYSSARVVLSKDRTDLEVTVSAGVEADWTAALGSVPIARSGGGQTITLRDVATLDAGGSGNR
jgi:HEAT repeats